MHGGEGRPPLPVISGRALAVCTFAVLQQSTPYPLIGTWQLNPLRSHYGGGAEPRVRETMVCRGEAVVIACTTESVRPDGRTVTASFMAPDDGTNGPVRGIEEMDSVKLVRVNSARVDATFSLHGRPVFGYRAQRSTDGKLLTITAVDPVTRATRQSVIVYDAK